MKTETKGEQPSKHSFHAGTIFAFCVALFLPLWIFVFTPNLLKIPDDFSYRADIISVDNFFDEAAQAFRGEQFSKTSFSYDVLSKVGNVLMIKNTFDVKTLDGTQIFKTEPVYAIDAHTGQHVKGIGDRERSGYLFAPRWLKEDDSFTYWHVTNNVPGDMKFVGKEKLYGLDVYKYETDYGGLIDQTASLGFLPGVPSERGIKLRAINRLWIEPISGYLVKQVDYSTDYYYYDIKTGKRLEQYNQFSNRFAEDSIFEHVKYAKQQKYFILFVTFGVPFLLLLLIGLGLLHRFGYLHGVVGFAKDNVLSVSVLTVMLALTVVSAVIFNSYLDQKYKNHFFTESVKVQDLILDRVQIYLNALRGGVALFDSKELVSRDEWHRYVSSVDFQKNYPGILGLGFAKFVPFDQKLSYIHQIRGEGFPNFTIFPSGDREQYVPVTYIEPFTDRNLQAFGYDMFSDSVRNMAMSQARDTGNPFASGKVTLVQENDVDVQAGSLLYLPLYRQGANPTTIEDRRKQILGYVYSPFRIADFFAEIFLNQTPDLHFHVYDGLRVNEDSLMHVYVKPGTVDTNDAHVVYKKIETIFVANHPWTIMYTNASDFSRSFLDRLLFTLILVGGTVVSFLVFFMLYAIGSSRRRAVAYAEKLNASLIKSENALIKKNEDMEKRMRELDAMNRVMVNRELKMIELKKEIDGLKKNV